MNISNRRVAVYIDGFNLYHALDDLNFHFKGRRKLQMKAPEHRVPHYKWLDLWRLSENLLRDYQDLVSVNYYSAFAHHRSAEGVRRHADYIAALEHAGVRVVMSNFKASHAGCRKCGHTWKSHEEKESDVRIAIDIVSGALLDQYDDAMILSADSDMKPAKELVEDVAPDKNVFAVAPPGRYSHARDLKPVMEATKGRVAKSLFPQEIRDSNGDLIVTRPSKYDPPR